ncbi:MAG TPA: FkbM family methyltransferase [Gaiellaceae bacterium]|nr:FkbM family methyltransferase [Gaiellaceae bacterium]
MSFRERARNGAARRMRAALLRSARRSFPALGVEHPAGTFVLPSDDGTILGKLYVDRRRSDFVVLARALQVIDDRRGTFIDVGANLGTTTLAAVRLHGFTRAVACEPDPDNARFLRATVAVNGLDDRISVVEAAVSDHVGEASFAARRAEGGRRMSGAGGLAGQGDLRVRVTTLDQLAQDGVYEPREVGLLWMDAQGAEGHALAGATSLAAVPVVTALRSRRLAKLDGLDLFREVVTQRFASFVELRGDDLAGAWSPKREPVSDIERLIGIPESTDVLLLP